MTVTQQDVEALRARVVRARARLGDAAAGADLRGIAAALDELEQAYGAARESGVTIPQAGQDRGETRS